MHHVLAMPESTPVHIFDHLDHRDLLRALFADRKLNGRGFSHRAFARRAGLTSTNYLKLVMDGKRNLSAEMAIKFATGFGLARDEAAYFCDLVAYNNATTATERTRAFERLSRFRQRRQVHQLDAEQARYHETWYLPAIRELVSSPAFRDDPKWIARQLLPRISTAQAQAALRTLLTLGLLTRDDDGRLRQADALVSTASGPLGHHVVNYHRMMMERAADALDRVTRNEREISSVTLCVSEDALLALKQRIEEFRNELLQLAEQHGTPERVVQINFQLFPLTQRLEETHE